MNLGFSDCAEVEEENYFCPEKEKNEPLEPTVEWIRSSSFLSPE